MNYPVNKKAEELFSLRIKLKNDIADCQDEMKKITESIGRDSIAFRTVQANESKLRHELNMLQVRITREHYREADAFNDVVKHSLEPELLQRVYNEVQRRLDGETPCVIDLSIATPA